MSEPTPFVRTKSGKIHVATCQIGGHGLPISLSALRQMREPVPEHYVTVTAGCCGACPDGWLRTRASRTTSNTEQATTRTAEQSHLTALAERDALTALTAQVEALTAQRDEAVRLLRLAEPGPLTAATRWWDESTALLRWVKR